MEIRCNSCNVSISNKSGTVQFNCPKCTKTVIVRCPMCRKNAAHYKCTSCNFEGPN